MFRFACAHCERHIIFPIGLRLGIHFDDHFSIGYCKCCEILFIITTEISIILCSLSQAWGNFDGNFFVIVCVTVLSIMCILPYCYYGTKISMRLQYIGEFAYAQTSWYKYPIHLQKYVQLTIAYSQRRKQFYGFNIFNCSLEVFMKVQCTLRRFKLHKNKKKVIRKPLEN